MISAFLRTKYSSELNELLTGNKITSVLLVTKEGLHDAVSIYSADVSLLDSLKKHYSAIGNSTVFDDYHSINGMYTKFNVYIVKFRTDSYTVENVARALLNCQGITNGDHELAVFEWKGHICVKVNKAQCKLVLLSVLKNHFNDFESLQYVLADI